MTYQEMADKANRAFEYEGDMAITADDVQDFLELHQDWFLNPKEARFLTELADDGA